MIGLSAFTRHNLNEQGFGYLSNAAKSSAAGPLRFTPGVSISLIAIGLARQSPLWLGAMALVGLIGTLFPRGMPVDLLYNFGVRHLFHAAPLPPTPRPRRFSYFISTVLLACSALSFRYGFPVLGFIFGGAVCVAGAVLTATLWCLGSWFYVRFGKIAAALK
jgi:hypothetical protein